MDKCKGCIHTDVCSREVGYGYAECPHYKFADIASRTEVARLQSQVNRLKKYDKERDIALHEKLIANTRQEVAREIFEEMEKRLEDIIVVANPDDCFITIFRKTMEKVTAEIDELKKKYMENK